MVCLAGDLLDQRAGVRLQRQIEDISRLLREFPVPLAISSGNHDQTVCVSGDENCRWLHDLRREHLWVDGDQFQLSGLRFRCVGWNDTMPVSPSDDVWIAHVPPAGCRAAKSRNGNDDGDWEFGLACELGNGPRLALCGHIHDPEAWADRRGGTLVLNAGSGAASVPNHIIVDFVEDRGHLRRTSAADETVTLKAVPPPTRQWQFTATTFDRLLALTLANQAAEGLVLSPIEIESCRQSLKTKLVKASGRTGP